MKKIILILFIIVALIQLAIPLNMIMSRERVLENGRAFKFKTMPIDPTDIFRGKYVSLNFQNQIVKYGDSIPSTSFDAFIIIGEDDDGFAEIKMVSIDRPESESDYFRAKVYKLYEDFDEEPMLNVEFPFDRFYMEESKAKPAEDIYNKTRNDSTQVAYALVYINDGNAVLKDVLINDISIKLLAKEVQDD